jgi:heptaprenyl diphosphate synthase
VSEGEEAGQARLRAILSGGAIKDDHLHAEALGLLRASSALARARGEVAHYAAEARSAARRLQDSPVRKVLESLCDLVTDRSA